MTNRLRGSFMVDFLYAVAIGSLCFLASVAIRSGIFSDPIVNDYSVSSLFIGAITALVIRRMVTRTRKADETK